MSEERKTIVTPDMCGKHRSLLVHQAGYKEADPWRALIIASSIALFQAATADDSVHKAIGGDITKISSLGCLACRKPDVFGEVVEAAKTRDFGKIKALGEKYVNSAKGEK